jgi:hypothetical protein
VSPLCRAASSESEITVHSTLKRHHASWATLVTQKTVDRELNLSQVADGPRRGRVGDLHPSTTDTPHENGRKLVHDGSLFRTTHGRTNDAQLYVQAHFNVPPLSSTSTSLFFRKTGCAQPQRASMRDSLVSSREARVGNPRDFMLDPAFSCKSVSIDMRVPDGPNPKRNRILFK